MTDTRQFGYARVSTTDQNLDRQIDALKTAGVEERNIICDRKSGKDFDRPGYQALKGPTGLRKGDTLVIKSLDRLGRNKAAIKQELESLRQMGVRVKILDLPTTCIDLPTGQEWVMDMVNNILLEVLSSIAEQERVSIKARQAEGIASAKAAGKHLGRPTATYPPRWAEVYQQWKAGQMTAKQAYTELELKKATFYNLAKKYEE